MADHKPNCQCVACKAMRKRAQENSADQPDQELEASHQRLSMDYQQTLDEMKVLRETIAAAQQELDAADVRKGEMEKVMRGLVDQRDEATRMLSRATDLLRSTSISHHRAEGHRGNINNCEDLICREACKAWFVIGELAGAELAASDPTLWWEKKDRNEAFAMNFGDPGPLEPEDVAAGLSAGPADEDDDGPEPLPEPQGELVDVATLDEIPDSPAFAGKKVRKLIVNDYDPGDPGMPKKARV